MTALSRNASFHLIIPSLPGFFLSTNPQREGWTVADTARVFNQLVVDILGYPRYLVHGGDWVRSVYLVRVTYWYSTLGTTPCRHREA
jgi:hypothetical protein